MQWESLYQKETCMVCLVYESEGTDMFGIMMDPSSNGRNPGNAASSIA